LKLVAYITFWLMLAPLIFTVTLDVLIYPLGLIANAIWPEIKPLPIKLIFWTLGAVALATAVASVIWIWKKYRDSVAQMIDSENTTRAT